MTDQTKPETEPEPEPEPEPETETLALAAIQALESGRTVDGAMLAEDYFASVASIGPATPETVKRLRVALGSIYEASTLGTVHTLGETETETDAEPEPETDAETETEPDAEWQTLITEGTRTESTEPTETECAYCGAIHVSRWRNGICAECNGTVPSRRPRERSVIDVLARADRVATEGERLAAYLYRGYRIESVREADAMAPPCAYVVLRVACPEPETTASVTHAYQLGRIQSGAFGASLIRTTDREPTEEEAPPQCVDCNAYCLDGICAECRRINHHRALRSELERERRADMIADGLPVPPESPGGPMDGPSERYWLQTLAESGEIQTEFYGVAFTDWERSAQIQSLQNEARRRNESDGLKRRGVALYFGDGSEEGDSFIVCAYNGAGPGSGAKWPNDIEVSRAPFEPLPMEPYGSTKFLTADGAIVSATVITQAEFDRLERHRYVTRAIGAPVSASGDDVYIALGHDRETGMTTATYVVVPASPRRVRH